MAPATNGGNDLLLVRCLCNAARCICLNGVARCRETSRQTHDYKRSDCLKGRWTAQVQYSLLLLLLLQHRSVALHDVYQQCVALAISSVRKQLTHYSSTCRAAPGPPCLCMPAIVRRRVDVL
jgi:hypothetical protein